MTPVTMPARLLGRQDTGADLALAPSGAKPVSRLGAPRIDQGAGDLREALIAYWTVEGCNQRADNLRMGWPLDHLDRRIAKAVAAFNGAYDG